MHKEFTHDVRDGGFTLTELMTVVVIVALLASIGAVSYGGYRRRSIAMEAEVNLHLIAASQEAYKAEFGVYLNVSTGATEYNPPTGDMTCAKRTYFPNPPSGCTGGSMCALFKQLGFQPENPNVYFRYRSEAGTAAPTGWPTAFITGDYGLGWYASEAVADMSCGGAETTYRAVSRRAGIVARLNEFE